MGGLLRSLDIARAGFGLEYQPGDTDLQE